MIGAVYIENETASIADLEVIVGAAGMRIPFHDGHNGPAVSNDRAVFLQIPCQQFIECPHTARSKLRPAFTAWKRFFSSRIDPRLIICAAVELRIVLVIPIAEVALAEVFYNLRRNVGIEQDRRLQTALHGTAKHLRCRRV